MSGPVNGRREKRMKKIRYIICLVLALSMVLTGIPGGKRTASATPVSSNGQLQVKGRYIVNKKEKESDQRG